MIKYRDDVRVLDDALAAFDRAVARVTELRVRVPPIPPQADTAPDEVTQYLGNVRSGGQSVTGGEPDAVNMEECVRDGERQAGGEPVVVIGQQ